MATLRKYSIVKTRRSAPLFSPERAILGLFCVAAGTGVFMAADNFHKGNGVISQLTSGHGVVRIPIAEQIARKLDEAGKGLNGQKPKPTTPKLDSSKISALLEEKKLQAITDRKLAADRRRKSEALFARRNVDRTPVASINGAGSSGFTEVRPVQNAPGFQELPRWRP